MTLLATTLPRRTKPRSTVLKSEDIASSRRQFVAGVTAGVASALTAPAHAQQASSAAGSGPAPGQAAKQNPVTQYPHPPFRQQPQEWPGLASKMDPPPDHGEKTYRGSGRLAGRKALITGGDSGIGRAAAIAFARE